MLNSQHRIYGIATDTVLKDGKILLDKGERQFTAVGWYRIVNPLEKIGAKITIGTAITSSAKDALKFKANGDIWFMKIADNEGIDHIYGAHRDFTGCKIVLDLDDDPRNTNEDHPDYQELKKREAMRVRMIKIADHVVVATPQIAQAIKDLTANVTVIPNAIDPYIWDVKKKKRTDGKIRIGWMSSGSHFSDVPIIKPVMDEIIEKYPNVEFHFAGMTWDEAKEEQFFHHVGCRAYKDFPKFYADLDIDISVAPLKDTQFNRCKSNIKWMEAAMLEIPTVASDVIPYFDIKHGQTGYLATNKNQWVKYLSWLIESKELRERIGKQAKADVLEYRTINKTLPTYLQLFDNIMDKKDISVITAITGGKDDLKAQPDYKGVEYIAFLDKEMKDSQWEVRKACDKFVKPVMNAKIHKILAHKYTDKPYIVWMDGNCVLKQDPHELVKLMGDKDFAFFKHPGRKCLFDEANICVEMGKGNPKEIAEQVKSYAKDEVKTKGFIEATCFIRKNNPKVNETFEKWWAEISRYSNRDQISFPVAFKGKKWATIPGTVYQDKKHKAFVGNDYFKYRRHKKYEG